MAKPSIGGSFVASILDTKDLFRLVHSDRESIPDVPAVYFLMPTEENIQRISQDFQNGLYDSYFLNFISPISRQKLEDLASSALSFGCVPTISKIFDQYLNFISIEDDLFILKHQSSDDISFYAINRGDIKDTEMDIIMDSIVDSLFSVFVTSGAVPIIRCPRGNAAEMVAEKLDKKLRENLRNSRNSLFNADTLHSGQLSFQRPLLVLLDRTVDLATPLHHTWTYQALAHDVLDLALNRVTLAEDYAHAASDHSRPKKKTKSYDLNPSDRFWSLHKGSPFPTVASSVQEELDHYRACEDQVKHLKSAMGLDGESDEAISMISDNTAKLTSAVSSLPELLEKKRLIDLHTTVATAILDEIKGRKLDVYFEIEERVMSKSAFDRSLMELIMDPEKGSPEDKLRLFLIAYICCPSMTEVEFDQYASALGNAGCDMNALNYVKNWKAFSKMATMPQYGGGGTKTVGMFSRLMTQGSQFVMEGVKNLVVKKHNLPVTRIVDALLEQKNGPEVEEYRYFDPKLLRFTDSNSIPRATTPFSDAIVFVVGGGNYIEYHNLLDYAKSKTGSSQKKLIYGTTQLINASQFLRQDGTPYYTVGFAFRAIKETR
ncbi:unnamed protein product, partial [Darwinula stevensoni]